MWLHTCTTAFMFDFQGQPLLQSILLPTVPAAFMACNDGCWGGWMVVNAT